MTLTPAVFRSMLPRKPVITKTPKGWRVDCPDGNYCYQPSESFAISWARQWEVSDIMRLKYAKDGSD